MPKKTFGADLYGKGENPNGMIAQTADGTVRNCDALGPQQYNWNQEADGPTWNSGFKPKPESFTAPAPIGRVRKRN
jgi:hypothetical protein